MILSSKKRAIKKIKALMYSNKMNIDAFRSTIEKKFVTPFLPSKVEYRTTIINGVTADLLIPEISAKNRVILYLYGGSFIGGSRTAWRSFCCSFANESSTRIIVPEIRSAPSAPYPGGLEDSLIVLRKMLEHDDEIYLAADSSGCSVALALALSLSAVQLKSIKGIVLFSPWLNLSASSSVFVDKASDGILSGDVIKSSATIYTHAANFESPLVSPLLQDPAAFKNFPSFFIQSGSCEPQLKDIHEFAKILKTQNVPLTIDIWDDMFHLFQFADEFLPQAQLAVEKAGHFVKQSEQIEENEWN